MRYDEEFISENGLVTDAVVIVFESKTERGKERPKHCEVMNSIFAACGGRSREIWWFSHSLPQTRNQKVSNLKDINKLHPESQARVLPLSVSHSEFLEPEEICHSLQPLSRSIFSATVFHFEDLKVGSLISSSLFERSRSVSSSRADTCQSVSKLSLAGQPAPDCV